MLVLRRLLVAFCVVLSGVSYALTPGERVVLFSGIRPVWQANFLSPVLVASQTLPAGLTYSKSGSIPATLFDSTGKLTYQGNNLLTYSNTFSTGWSFSSVTVSNPNAVSDPFGGTNATTITATANAAQLYQYLAISSAASTNYVTSIWVKRRSGSGNIRIFNPNSTTTVIPVTSTWTKFSSSGAGGPGFIYPGILIATNGDAVDVYAATASAVTYETTPRSQDQVITTSTAYYGPRLDTNPSTLAPAGLLVEEQRVQIFSYSNAFTTLPWAKTGASTALTSAAITSPDGTSNGWKVQTGVATETFGIYQPFTYTAAAYTISIFAKAGSYNYICLDFNNAGTSGAVFDLSDGSIGYTDAGVTASVQTIGNGWYRLSATSTRAAASQFPEFYFSTSRTSNSKNFTGDGSQYFYAYGAQLELGSFPTSYIPNATASTVTRTADVVTFTGVPLAVFKGSTASVVAEGDGANSTTNFRYLWATDPIAAEKFLQASLDGTTGWYISGISPSGYVANATNRVAVSFNVNGNVSSVINGGTVVSSSSSDFTGSPTNAYLGNRSDFARALNGHARSIALYNQVLPPPTLKARSVAGAPY